MHSPPPANRSSGEYMSYIEQCLEKQTDRIERLEAGLRYLARNAANPNDRVVAKAALEETDSEKRT